MSKLGKDSQTVYHRPGDTWLCGRNAQGMRCPEGPSSHGNCPHSQCRPGRRSHWWRNYLRAIIAMVGVCSIAIVLSTRWHREFLAPGPLSKAHAQILNSGTTENRCATCHPAGSLPAIAWFASFNSTLPESQSNANPHGRQQDLCLNCHQSKMPNLALASPHDLAKSELEQLMDSTRQRKRDMHLASAPIHWKNHELACSDCHREHQGPNHDLSAIASQRCQSCHQQQFASFRNGHPEFQSYPYDRQRNLAFDHSSHRDKHFAKKESPFDCRTCHVDVATTSSVGQVFRSVSYANACASCHDEGIRATLADGIPVLQLPSIDKKQLAKYNVRVDWPEESGQMMDGTIPPIMQLLLASDEQGARALAGIPDGNLGKLKLSDKANRLVVVDLMDATRRLLREIAEDGQDAVSKRIVNLKQGTEGRTSTLVSFNPDSSAMQTPSKPLDEAWKANLLQGMPPDLFRQAYREWFGSESGPEPPSARLQPPPQARKSKTNNTPSSSEGDLLAGGDLSSSESNTEWKPKPLKPIRHLKSGGWMIDERRMAIVYVPTGHADPWLASWIEFAQQTYDAKSSQNATQTASEWYDEEKPSLVFIPGQELLQKTQPGNCNQCHSLRNLAPQTPRGPKESFVSLRSSEKSTSTPQLALHIANPWRAQQRPVDLRQFTRFDHSPHLLLPSLADCKSCHRLANMIPKESDTTSQTTANRVLATGGKIDASHPTNIEEFLPMKKGNCADCHRENGASQNCTQCHNYHVNFPK